MKKALYLLSILIVILTGCFYLLLKDDAAEGDATRELEVHCAAVMRMPVKEIAEQYEAEYGVKILLNYGGSGQLYGSAKLKGGDLYIPADSSYLEIGEKDGLIEKSIALSYLTAGIVVPKGNPKGIQNLEDLTREDVKVAIAVRSAAVGKLTHEVLENAYLLERVEAGMLSKFPTVSEVVSQVGLGAVDAGIVWDALMPQNEGLDFIHVPEFDSERKMSAVGLISTSNRRVEAIRFARYLAAKDRGRVVFRKYGFEMVRDVGWKENPSLNTDSTGN